MQDTSSRVYGRLLARGRLWRHESWPQKPVGHVQASDRGEESAETPIHRDFPATVGVAVEGVGSMASNGATHAACNGQEMAHCCVLSLLAEKVERTELYRWSSAAAHCGFREDPLLSEWAPPKGPTSNWSTWLASEEAKDELESLRDKTKTGRPWGSDGFIEQLESELGRPLKPQKGGRRPPQTT